MTEERITFEAFIRQCKQHLMSVAAMDEATASTHITNGIECYQDYYEMEMSPEEAIAEDIAHWDE